MYLRWNLCHGEKERDSAVSLSVLGKCSNNKERDNAVSLFSVAVTFCPEKSISLDYFACVLFKSCYNGSFKLQSAHFIICMDAKNHQLYIINKLLMKVPSECLFWP